MSAHSSRVMSIANSCLDPAHFGCLRSQASKRDPRFLNVNDCDGQSIRYALLMASNFRSPNTARKPGKSSIMLDSRRNQYCRLYISSRSNELNRSLGLINCEAYARMDLPSGAV